ncbi:universal stress protein [Pedobacter insulae]|uniref:Nucleotide-binding universal stress protein, UspA family n=1 Tax=Pedobacter insulae TaxID=414048 RepID=A0A1I3A235_9SPHI|nr:universal stress protein [Pedobacter insulae]SFH43975.1 Nucleotide-binding universal stress protein, UspA family [Pedobacter insulae]
MKKILVPIDYSTYADNAVYYAIQIAKKIGADIHLFHALEHELIPTAGIMMWPVENFEKSKEDSDKNLLKYIDLLKEMPELSLPYLPNISYSSETGSVKQIIDKLTTEDHYDLIIMGLAGAGKVNRFFLGSNSRDVIGKTKVPLLLVPKVSAYQPLKKIAFATDLGQSDINSIHAIAKLFCLFNPEILLAHVDTQLSDIHNPNSKANLFLNSVTNTLNYSKIYYRHLNATSVEDGLKWLSENGQINILAMIHRHSSIFSRIIDGSHTHKLAAALHCPLLVMPEDKTPIGW